MMIQIQLPDSLVPCAPADTYQQPICKFHYISNDDLYTERFLYWYKNFRYG
jgi:hypothetical protein